MADNQHPAINWRSRIVKYGKIAASQITPHPNNPRKHPQLQRQAVAASFDELGQIAPVIINSNNGYLVDGEERSWLALGQGDDVEVDAIWVDLSEEEHNKALVYFDATGDLATYDAERLALLLEDVNSDDSAIQQMIKDLDNGLSTPSMGDWQNALGGLADGDRAPFQQMTFTLHDEQAETVKRAIETAKSLGAFVDSENENSNGNALARVCELFLGDHG